MNGQFGCERCRKRARKTFAVMFSSSPGKGENNKKKKQEKSRNKI